MQQHDEGRPVKIVGIMLPWSDVFFLILQLTIVTTVIGGAVAVALAVLGVF